jgi:hypothetical protein
MDKIDQGKPKTILLNIVLLFFVAVEPYLLNIVNTSAELFPLSSTLYGIDMAFLMGISASLCHILIKENKPTLTVQQLRHFTISRNNQFICMGLFFLSILPWFLEWTIAGIPARVLIWFATLIFSLIISSRNKNK